MAVLLLSSFLLKLRHLGHRFLFLGDESYHAIVARNLLKHPFKPTLIDVPYLPYDLTNWMANHVWLHKPILPLWQIAASYTLFGIDTFALRLPSAVLGTGAVGLTYLIGRELVGCRAAFIAATIQAFLPVIIELTHGYLFSDAIDISLLFWAEFAIYFLVRSMQTGRWRDVLLAGIGQGLAFLSKSYPAMIVTGIALTAWLAPMLRLGKQEETKLRGRHVLGLLLATLVTVDPWMLYTAIRFPVAFRHEHALVWQHLKTNVEGWAAPWDRLLFDYAIFIYRDFYAPILVSAIFLLGRLFSRRDTGLCIVYAWGFGVLIPHLLATAKTPSATVLGIPAFLLLLGVFAEQAWQREHWGLSIFTATVVIGACFPTTVSKWGKGYAIGSIALGEAEAMAGYFFTWACGSLSTRTPVPVFVAKRRSIFVPLSRLLRL